MTMRGATEGLGDGVRPSAVRLRDADLVAACGRGEYDAVLASLMERYRQKVWHLTYSLVREQALAEDLAQSAFHQGVAGLAELRWSRGALDLAVYDRTQHCFVGAAQVGAYGVDGCSYRR